MMLSRILFDLGQIVAAFGNVGSLDWLCHTKWNRTHYIFLNAAVTKVYWKGSTICFSGESLRAWY